MDVKFLSRNNEFSSTKIYEYLNQNFSLNICDYDGIIDKYKFYIYERYLDLLNSGKKEDELTNNDLCKIFEYYSCIKLTEEYGQIFYEYNDIDPLFKEENQMTKNDTGIDACNLKDTIVQCKLRKDVLSWRECATFFGSQVFFDPNQNKNVIKWDKLIITRNEESTLTDNLKFRKRLFVDRPYKRSEIIDYCKNIKPVKVQNSAINIKLRDYQIECIKLIKETEKNIIICLPTATGKNLIIINSMKEGLKYLILVPKIILMEQLKTEIIKFRPELKNKIQSIGDGNNKFDKNKNVVICVFNSVDLIKKYHKTFTKIFIDEAHHIYNPEIYENLKNFNEESFDSLSDSYLKTIRKMSKYNNNVCLSATIDNVKNFVYYKKDIREMINQNYLCDYTLNIPIFDDNPNNEDICKYLLKNYRNIIVYCNSQIEGKLFNKIFNELQNKSSAYVDCETSTSKRNEIIRKYKEGITPFLVNVRVLVEGFDAPITKGVCFIHLPSNKTTAIQIVGRALRLHPLKTIANIILPFSTKEDGKSINNFVSIIAGNDERINESYKNKTLGGYISINNAVDDEYQKDDEESCENDEEKTDIINFRYELIYNSMGILRNNEAIWMNKLENVQNYIDKNNKLPPSTDKDRKIKIMGRWMSLQKKNYKNKTQIMENDRIYDLWTTFTNCDKYKKYFLSDDIKWKNRLKNVKEYVDKNNRLPSDESKNKEIKTMGRWIASQKGKYKNDLGIMQNKKICKLWEEFVNDEKYKKYFMSYEEIRKNNLKQVKLYIKENKKLPASQSKNVQTRILGAWVVQQKQNYKKKQYNMANQKTYDWWSKFINDEKYKKYLMNDEEVWINKLERVKSYITKNGKNPSTRSKDRDIELLGVWLLNQRQNYKKNEQIVGKNKKIRDLWLSFINNERYHQK
jgi:superfamily II DNA or RNA helicase